MFDSIKAARISLVHLTEVTTQDAIAFRTKIGNHEESIYNDIAGLAEEDDLDRRVLRELHQQRPFERCSQSCDAKVGNLNLTEPSEGPEAP